MKDKIKYIFHLFETKTIKGISWRKIAVAGISVVMFAYIAWETYWFFKVGAGFIKWHTYVFISIISLGLLIHFLNQKKRLHEFAKYFIFIIYIIACRLIGEIHPFSTVEMYSKIPNWAYVFYLKDNKNNVLFTNYYFNNSTSPDRIGHQYASFFESKKIYVTGNSESEKDLKTVGEIILNSLKFKHHRFSSDTVYLVRKHLYINLSGDITEEEKIIVSKQIP